MFHTLKPHATRSYNQSPATSMSLGATTNQGGIKQLTYNTKTIHYALQTTDARDTARLDMGNSYQLTKDTLDD